MDLFYFDDVGHLYDYVGCKINRDDCSTFTQLVMLQSFSNEFILSKWVYTTSSIPGKTLTKAMEQDFEPPEEMT